MAIPLIGISAQKCVIEGELTKDSLRFEQKKVEQVYLTALDEYDVFHVVDSAKVKNGKFKFIRQLNPNDPILLYFITGFDNGAAQFFLEAGTVHLKFDAAFPSGCTAKGTPNNDLMEEYKMVKNKCIVEQNDSARALKAKYGDNYTATPEGYEAWVRLGAEALMVAYAEQLKFLARHYDSPLAPLMMDRELYFLYDKRMATRMVRSISPKLKNHPYYISLQNNVRAMDLKVGDELPDIELPMKDGTKKRLSDFQGKFLLLDFWASWCGPCLREMPKLKELYEENKDNNFAIISYSLDDKENAWKGAVARLEIDKPNWLHASDLKAWKSPAAVLMGVTEIPRTILVSPDGRAIAFNLRGDELIQKVEQILMEEELKK